MEVIHVALEIVLVANLVFPNRRCQMVDSRRFVRDGVESAVSCNRRPGPLDTYLLIIDQRVE